MNEEDLQGLMNVEVMNFFDLLSRLKPTHVISQDIFEEHIILQNCNGCTDLYIKLLKQMDYLFINLLNFYFITF